MVTAKGFACSAWGLLLLRNAFLYGFTPIASPNDVASVIEPKEARDHQGFSAPAGLRAI